MFRVGEARPPAQRAATLDGSTTLWARHLKRLDSVMRFMKPIARSSLLMDVCLKGLIKDPEQIANVIMRPIAVK